MQPALLHSDSAIQPSAKKSRARRSKANSLSVVAPRSGSRMASTHPQTPPPSASRRHDLTPPASFAMKDQQWQSHPSTGGKTVPHAFLTPQSVRRRQPSSDWQGLSSPVAADAASNALGIFVNEPEAADTPLEHRDVNPTLIYSGAPSHASHLMHSAAANQVSDFASYTKIFHSPIQYPPYLGKRSLSDFGAMSAGLMHGNDGFEKRRHKRSRTVTSISASDSTPVREPRSPPLSATTLCFSISDHGEAMIECRSSPSVEYSPGLDTPMQPHSRNHSASTSITTISSSDSLGLSDSDSDISEAETEIFDPKLENVSRTDARVAMAKAIRRQQALLQVYRERVASRDTARTEKKKSRRMKRSASSGDLHDTAFRDGQSTPLSAVPQGLEMIVSTSMPGRIAYDARQQQSQKLQEYFHNDLDAQQEEASRVYTEHEHMRRYSQQQEENRCMQEMVFQRAVQAQAVIHQPMQQVRGNEDLSQQPVVTKRKRGRPKKTVSQDFGRAPAQDESVSRCVCEATKWYGEPMIQW